MEKQTMIQRMVTHWDICQNHLFPLCDLMSLIRLAWTCRSLRTMLDQVDTVMTWQDKCWYLYRECLCDRNLYYLRAEQFCSFAYDWNETAFHSQYEADLVLRQYGRSLTMYLSTDVGHGAEPMRVPFLNPQGDQTKFRSGVCQTWIEDLIVPMPRMLRMGVENLSNAPPMNHARTPDETDDMYEYRCFWRQFHEVTPNQPAHKLQTDHIAMTRIANWSPVDRVDEYRSTCLAHGRDPHDPMDDPECEGYLAGTWARRCMYQSPVGLQHYPLEICIAREEMEPPKARTDGVDYVERVFLPIQPLSAYPCSGMLLQHHGIAYFHGVRYENEAGDFVNWALSTHTLTQGFYRMMWLEVSNHFLKLLYQTLRNLAHEIETDLPMERMAKRWRYLEHLMVCGKCTDGSNRREDAWQRDADRDGVDFLRETPQYGVYHNVIRHLVREDEDMRRRCTSSLMSMDEVYAMVSHQYMNALLPQQGFMENPRRNETQVMIELHYMLELFSYMLRFTMTLCPRVSCTTTNARRTTLKIYLTTGFSLLAFAPGWHGSSAGGALIHHHRPSKTHERVTALTIPSVNLTNNHRYHKYLHFLTARNCYYDERAVVDRTVLDEHEAGKAQSEAEDNRMVE